jgi:hypothetical protein
VWQRESKVVSEEDSHERELERLESMKEKGSDRAMAVRTIRLNSDPKPSCIYASNPHRKLEHQ